jgi:type VI secretion system secreted protein VgrG
LGNISGEKMFNTPLQAGRLLQIKSPLAEDQLLATEFFADETMSRAFLFSLDMISANADIQAKQLLQKPIAIAVNVAKSAKPRYFHGLVSSFEAGPLDGKMRYYRAELRPWLWFLNYNVDCRVFQNKNAPDIIRALFKKQQDMCCDFSQLEMSKYPIRDYCFQYRESDFQFVQRLLAEEGIFYYFKHEQDDHTLVFGDENSAFTGVQPNEVNFTSGSAKGFHIQQWSRSHHFYTGTIVQSEYDFKNANTSLLTKQAGEAKLASASQYELYNYPTHHESRAISKQRAQRYFEAQELTYQLRQGSGNYPHFYAGGSFSFPDPPLASEAGDYLLISVAHHVVDGTYLNGPTGVQSYYNSFTAIPDKFNFRSSMELQRPVIASVQTAMVVGPDGEEIYADSYGRVKVQFHWDRDEHNSCWIRVAQLWAGNDWGVQFIPRIGQEVVVQFIEGNPDRPLITGCVYNSNHQTPYHLPFAKTQSGIKTQSSKGATKEDYNELRFEDKAGAEEIFIQAQKDFNQKIKNNLNIYVGKAGSFEATESLTLKVGGNSILINTQGIFINGSQVNINK